MIKVKRSLTWGDNSSITINHSNNIHRTKRRAVDCASSHKKCRVVKKLIRINNRTINAFSRKGRHYNSKIRDPGEIVGVQTLPVVVNISKSPRKRIIVTKRRKLTPTTVKKRRKILITKRRLLPTSTLRTDSNVEPTKLLDNSTIRSTKDGNEITESTPLLKSGSKLLVLTYSTTEKSKLVLSNAEEDDEENNGEEDLGEDDEVNNTTDDIQDESYDGEDTGDNEDDEDEEQEEGEDDEDENVEEDEEDEGENVEGDEGEEDIDEDGIVIYEGKQAYDNQTSENKTIDNDWEDHNEKEEVLNGKEDKDVARDEFEYNDDRESDDSNAQKENGGDSDILNKKDINYKNDSDAVPQSENTLKETNKNTVENMYRSSKSPTINNNKDETEFIQTNDTEKSIKVENPPLKDAANLYDKKLTEESLSNKLHNENGNDPTTESENVQSINSNSLPDYEPFFPELSETLNDPIFKTTVISSLDFETKTVVQSRLRTYTFLITRVNGDEKITTSMTEVKPQTKTLTVTETKTRLTTLTLLDLDETNVLPYVPLTPSMDSPTTPIHSGENDATFSEEPRYNLATRVMSNGVEVIVAGDKTTLPGEPDVRRIPPSSIYKPVTLKPSTLSNHMSLLVPQDASQVESLSASLQSNPFVTKTCVTTYTYFTTFLQNGSVTISSHEQIVSNVATEEKNSAKIRPTSTAGITLTEPPNLAVGVFPTTYTYLNTILDGEQPLVVSSKHVISNTLTAPDDYLSLLQPSEKATPVRETNTYYSTIPLKKTLQDGDSEKVFSTSEILTQVIITQSVPPKSTTSVMTSYIALDVDGRISNRPAEYSTTDVVKTYYVTYTYYNTVTENNTPVTKTNVAISSDVVTEKLYIHPQKTQDSKPNKSVINSTPIKEETSFSLPDGVQLVTTKTYITTYTYYTTLLQNDKKTTSTIIKSHTKEVENIVTETFDVDSIQTNDLKNINSELQKGVGTVVEVATLKNGQIVEVTAIDKNNIKPTQVVSIEETQTATLTIESSMPNIITGSTIVFFEEDDDPFKVASKKATPTLKTKPKVTKTATKNELNSLLSSEIVKNTKVSSVVNKQSIKKIKHDKRPTSGTTKTKISPSSSTTPSDDNKTSASSFPPQKIKTANKIGKPTNNIPDLLGLGTINVETLHALTPVISAMAGLIKTNLKNNKRNETSVEVLPPVSVKERHKQVNNEAAEESQNKPIYIPLQQFEDDTLEIAESQNIATFHIKQWEKTPENLKLKNQKESPLLNGGIPISPGEIITANSDVIVGKPGRVGPRIPTIPLENPLKDEIAIGMKPPPIPSKIWVNRSKQKLNEQLPAESMKKEKLSTDHKATYLRPPMPSVIPLRPSYAMKEENYNPHVGLHRKPSQRIPIPHPQENIPLNENSPAQFVYNDMYNIPNMHIRNYSKFKMPIEPSALDELIVLPEVIERSSGQPLLVNLQPSQIAYVNIPHNRSTALIFGGSTEPHINGQYFDDPSPYTQLEFSAASENNPFSQVTSAYDQVQSPDQKKVGGVIKVGSDIINVNPSSSILVETSHIRPSKPLGDKYETEHNKYKDMNINVPPLSFGMIHQGDEFNGHIINHQDSINFKPPPINFDVVAANNHEQVPPKPVNYNSHKGSQQPEVSVYQDNKIKKNKTTISNNSFNQYNNNYVPHKGNVPFNKHNHFIPAPFRTTSSNHPSPTRRRRPSKPHIYLRNPSSPLEFMTPPPPVNPFTAKAPQLLKKPDVLNSIPNPPSQPQLHNLSDEEDAYDEPLDSFSEDGEFVQESNNRPLYPDEIPKEILKLNRTKQKPTDYNQRFPTSTPHTFVGNNKDIIRASTIPFVRPENQLTNQIIKNEDSSVFQSNEALSNANKNSVLQKRPDQNSQVNINKISTTTPYLNTEERYPQTTEDPSDKTSNNLHPLANFAESTSKDSSESHTVYTSNETSEEINMYSTSLNRPKVTSMPVDSPVLQKEEINRKSQTDTQTEKPFDPNLVTNYSETYYNSKNSTFSQANISQKENKQSPNNSMSILKDEAFPGYIPNENESKGEVLTSLEIMKPPPIYETQPGMVNQKPPKITINFPSGEIHHVPNFGQKHSIYNVMGQLSSPRPFSRKPPPVGVMTEEILGMNPPSSVTTYKPILSYNASLSSHKPHFSLQIDIPKQDVHAIQNISVTTPRPRRPFTRKPSIQRSTTTSTTTDNFDTNRQNSTSSVLGVIENTTRPQSSSVSDNKMTTSPTTVIPTTNTGENEYTKSSLPPTSNTIAFSRKTTKSPSTTLNGLNSIVKGTTKDITTTTTTKSQTESVTEKKPTKYVPTKRFNFTYHGGNEKDIDYAKVRPPIESSEVSLPTHRETYIKTVTATTVKTTVIKTSNGPPRTSTVLVTKTEKLTIIDTVTEFHTLLKPTSIYETITTTVSPTSTQLYPPGVTYGNHFSIKPTSVRETSTTKTTTPEIITENSLEEFIIKDELPPSNKTIEEISDSIFVVMTDKNHGNVVQIPEAGGDSYETQNRDEMLSNENANHILLGGILIASPPSINTQETTSSTTLSDRCIPECQASKNELCQRVEGIMRCVCRPGFARMFPDRPCKPTYTYRLKILLERHGKQQLMFHESLKNPNSTEFARLSAATQDGLDRMIMQSDLRDIYHGIQVQSYEPVENHQGIVSNFYLQLSDNTSDDRLKEILKKYLRNNNYSVGGTELYAAKEGIENLDADDFDECSNKMFHDCSENAHCFNLPGTYTCSCKEGFADLSENILYPGRICSAELVGCEQCNYHGTCYSRGDDQILCECFHWYAGEKCHINLKVLLIALITLGSVLFVLLIVCIVMTCSNGKQRQNAAFATGMSFMPQRVAIPDNRRGTLDRRAMIQDTSSESGQSDTLPYVAKKSKKVPKGALKKPPPPPPTLSDANNSDNNPLPTDQKDRSLTVMIPRAKYHPVPPISSPSNPEASDNRKNSMVSSNEAKLLSYLDAGPTPNAKPDTKRKYSAPNETYLPESVIPRKPSGGALVSAGFEVSATVNIGNLDTLETTGGTEADRSENATLIQKISADLLSTTGSRSQFNTLRDDFGDAEMAQDSLENWLEITPKITTTVSEARSYDETTIQAPTKSMRNGYELHNCNDEANTMAERDVGSTFLLPHTHLYKPDRGSDISGFDSL